MAESRQTFVVDEADAPPSTRPARPTRWRMWFRAVHRDLGYLFFGVTVVYACSGLALNHRSDWNPNYSVERKQVAVPAEYAFDKPLSKSAATSLLTAASIDAKYKKHYAPDERHIRIFLENGTATIDRETRQIDVELLNKRPFLNTFNKLHLNPGRWWVWFADAYAISLIVIAVTGLFLLRGKYGITRRGGVLTAVGIAVPVILVCCYLA